MAPVVADPLEFWDHHLGIHGSALLTLSDRYQFSRHHPVFKSTGTTLDPMMTGGDVALILLIWGNVSAGRKLQDRLLRYADATVAPTPTPDTGCGCALVPAPTM